MGTQELYCHDCGTYLRFETKPEKSGALVIVCDKCGHQHCRYVRQGVVLSDRWEQRYSKASKSFGVMANSNKRSLWEEKNGSL